MSTSRRTEFSRTIVRERVCSANCDLIAGAAFRSSYLSDEFINRTGNSALESIDFCSCIPMSSVLLGWGHRVTLHELYTY